MENKCIVGVNDCDIASVLELVQSLVGDSRGSSLNAVALLLACSELSILLASATWCVKEGKGDTIKMLRKKAIGKAWRSYSQFKGWEAS